MGAKKNFLFTGGLVLACAFLAAPSKADQGPVGHWYGFIDWPGYGKSRVALTVEKSGKGDVEAWYDNIEGGFYKLGFKNVTVTEIVFNGETINGEAVSLTLTTKDSLVGTFNGLIKTSPRLVWKSCPIELNRGMNFSIPRVDSQGKIVTDYNYRAPSPGADGWETADIRSLGGNPQGMNLAVKAVLDSTYSNIHSLLVIRRGKLVLDEYFYGYGPEDEHTVQSVTKSVLSILFGVAEGRGLINTNQKLYDLFPHYDDKPGWDPRKSNITLGMVLSMTAGFACNGLNDSTGPQADCDRDMDQSPDWLNFCLSLPLANDPGRHFSYCTACMIPLGVLIERQSGMSLHDFTQKYLFDPLDIHEVHWNKGPHHVTSVGGGLWMRPRDMAKLGLLYLNQGKWKGKQVVPTPWVTESTTPKPAGDGIPPPDERPDYGYLWWCAKVPAEHEGIRAFHAAGKGGQLIIVVPQKDLVCVITAGNFNETGHEIPEMELFMKYIYPSFS